MLSAWENRRPFNAAFNSRIHRIKLRVNRWIIYSCGSGDPNKNPFILTSRLRNVPFISLRNEEYIDFLPNQDFVGEQWDKKWEHPEKLVKERRAPLGEVNKNGNHRARNNMPVSLNQNFHIFNDHETNKENNNETVVRRKQIDNQYIPSFQILDEKDFCLLDSFEKQLIASASLSERENIPLFWQEKKLGKNSTPLIYVSTKKKELPIKLKESYTELFKFDTDEKRKIDIIDGSKINLTLEPEFDQTNFHSTMKRAVKNYETETKFQILKFDGDCGAWQKDIRNSKLKGWIENTANPETKNTFNSRLTLNSYPVPSKNKNELLPLIQRADFFSRSNLASRESIFNYNKQISFSAVEELKHFQVQDHSRSEKQRQIFEKKKIIEPEVRDKMEPHLKLTNLGTDLKHGSFPNIKSNTKKADLIQSIARNIAVDDLVAKKKTKNRPILSGVERIKQDLILKQSKKASSRWRLFSGFRQHENNQIKELFNSVEINKDEDPAAIRLLTCFEILNEMEQREMAETVNSIAKKTTQSHSSTNDVYEILASYEDTIQ